MNKFGSVNWWILVGCVAAICFGMAACGGGSSPAVGPGGPSLSLSTSMAIAPQDGTPAHITATVTGNSGTATLSVSGVPNGSTSQIVQPSGGSAGTITLTSSATTPAGTYPLMVTATAGNSTASQSLALVVAVSMVASSTVDANMGVNGKLKEFMSTSFQPAEWDYQFFQSHTASEPAQLNLLGPQHIRIQGISQAVPMKSNTGMASDWDFTKLDGIVQPVLGAADHSPEFQIAVAPPFMNDANGHLDIANHLNDFVQYSANLVRYYNGPGFDWGGQHFESPSLLSANPHKITWWGIFNEYNINGLTAAQYVQLYNAVVPAMLMVDPSIKFSALELADFDFQTGDPRNNLPTFVQSANAGGVTAHVDIVSTHFYSSCNQKDTDTQLFASVASFTNDVSYFYQELKMRADLANVPVWVTENNVNADFNKGNGISACNGTTFVTDKRGSSAFFAAWRPYVFSQLGKAGNQALYHWDYDADAQYGEADFNTGNKQLSYWVDYWLGQLYPQSPSAPDILSLTATESATVEALATKDSDGSALIMVADRAVVSPTDNNGAGDPRIVIVDVSALGNFSSASQLNLDAAFNVSNGQQPAAISMSPKLTVNLPGYGVTFLILKP
jgi:hypothetical protein